MAQATRNGPGSASTASAEAAAAAPITKRKVVEDRARSYFEALARARHRGDGRALDRGRRGRHRPVRHPSRPERDRGLLRRPLRGAARPGDERRARRGHRAPRGRRVAHGRALHRRARSWTSSPRAAASTSAASTSSRSRTARSWATRPTTTAPPSPARWACCPSEGSGAERAMKGAFNAITKMRASSRADVIRATSPSPWASSGGSPPGPSASRPSTPSCSRRSWSWCAAAGTIVKPFVDQVLRRDTPAAQPRSARRDLREAPPDAATSSP